jgi:RNase P subunit RPR2
MNERYKPAICPACGGKLVITQRASPTTPPAGVGLPKDRALAVLLTCKACGRTEAGYAWRP